MSVQGIARNIESMARHQIRHADRPLAARKPIIGSERLVLRGLEVGVAGVVLVLGGCGRFNVSDLISRVCPVES
jgi:hypothetical protein